MFKRMLVGSVLTVLIFWGLLAFTGGREAASRAAQTEQPSSSADVGNVVIPADHDVGIILRLNDKSVSIDERAWLLEALGQYNNSPSPQTIDYLIRWLEYEHWNQEFKRSFVNSTEYVMPDFPAQKALIQIGTAAVPQLVDEYIHCATTGPEGRRGRHGPIQLDENYKPRLDETGQYIPIENPASRLSSIAVILCHSPEVARKTVEYADSVWVASSNKPRIQAVCRELIEGTVSQYREPDHRRLFPTYFPVAPAPRAVR